MAKNKSERWKRIESRVKGHRFWTDTWTGRVAVSDQSGDHYRPFAVGRPDECEDGILYLDLGETIKLAYDTGSFHLPLKDEAGNRCSTVASTLEALWVAFRIGMAIEGGGYVFSPGMPQCYEAEEDAG